MSAEPTHNIIIEKFCINYTSAKCKNLRAINRQSCKNLNNTWATADTAKV